MTDFVSTAKPFDGLKNKVENWFDKNYPNLLESGAYSRVAIGRNNDSDAGSNGGFKIKGEHFKRSALYLETPEKMIPDKVLADPVTRVPAVGAKINDSVKEFASALADSYVKKGMERQEARAKVADSINKIAYYDAALAKYIAEPIVKGVNDSILSGLQTPYWNISVIQKIFKQPFMEGYAKHLVDAVGIPNVWADAVQIFTESFEGMPRVSSAAHATPEINTSATVKNRIRTMVSEFINIVIDFETSEFEDVIKNQNGNWLTGAAMGDREVYGKFMLEQLMNILYYFGHPESGFEGLTQIANRDGYYEFFDSTVAPLNTLWDDGYTGSNTTVGADAIMRMNKFIADMWEEHNFMPVDIRISCSPIVYKVLKWALYSKTYNPSSPLEILSAHFGSNESIDGTMAVNSANGMANYTLCPDPMLMPHTPFNDTDEDLMFITFPKMQSALPSGLDSLVLAPTAIEYMVLPNYPHRDGLLRTGLKRVGSLLCPVKKCVKVISGFGTNGRYTP